MPFNGSYNMVHTRYPFVIWWKNSVLWVIIISIYANIVGHLSGYSAARADQAAESETK